MRVNQALLYIYQSWKFGEDTEGLLGGLYVWLLFLIILAFILLEHDHFLSKQSFNLLDKSSPNI